MNILQGDIEGDIEGVIDKYREVSEKNKQLIIKKNVLDQLLKGTQSEAVRMVLDKVASGQLTGVTKGQRQFVTILQENNYDINKIIDVYVKTLNNEVDKRSAQERERADRERADREGWANFSEKLGEGKPARHPSTRFRPVTAEDLHTTSRTDLTARDYSEKAAAAAEAQTPPEAAAEAQTPR